MIAEEVAGLLLELKAVQVSPHHPFTYASGLKGPIYCDNRQIWSHVKTRNRIIQLLLDLIQKEAISFEVLAGLATAGIPHAAILAHRLEKPLIYIRGKAKEHGKQNQIEGSYQAGQEILLVEDLVNQGKSLFDAFSASLQAKLKVKGCLCIVDYQMAGAQKILTTNQIPLFSLTNLEAILNKALKLKYLDAEGAKLVEKWQKNPEKEGQLFS